MKNPWLAVLDHRFLDLHLTNCRHVNGSFDVSSPEPRVVQELNPDNVLSYYAEFDGQTNWFRFAPQIPLREVIGHELRVKSRLRYPFRGQHLNTLCWGANWSLGVRNRQLAATMAGNEKAWSGFPNIAGEWFEIGWSWRVNGQSVLSFNRKVVASWPDVGVDQPYEFSLFGLGSGARFIPSIPPGPPGIDPLLFFPADIAAVQLNLLTRQRSEKSVDAVFPMVGIENQEISGCWEQIAPGFRALITLFRTLVSTAVANQPRAAAILHDYAVKAAQILARYLDGQDDALAPFERALEKFLRQLKELAGGQLSAVELQVKQILAGMDASVRCKEAATQYITRNKKELHRLQLLLDTVSRTIRTTLEVNWNG